MTAPFSVGFGYDVHRLIKDRPLFLCGLEIPFDKGLEAHSDGDVALHAIMDALLGAANMGDIGVHFPPGDPSYKDADSGRLLQEVKKLLDQKGYQIGNIDITIIAERPKITPYIPAMKERITALIGQNIQVSIKATTNERLGFIGREEGIAAQAVALLFCHK